MAAHQAPPSLGFSWQEHWSGLSFPSQCMKVKSESEVAQSTPWTAAYQAPPSMGFSRPEYWSGVPLPGTLKCAPYILLGKRQLPPFTLSHVSQSIRHGGERRNKSVRTNGQGWAHHTSILCHPLPGAASWKIQGWGMLIPLWDWTFAWSESGSVQKLLNQVELWEGLIYGQMTI